MKNCGPVKNIDETKSNHNTMYNFRVTWTTFQVNKLQQWTEDILKSAAIQWEITITWKTILTYAYFFIFSKLSDKLPKMFYTKQNHAQMFRLLAIVCWKQVVLL
jgi:hypothetical protein